MSAADCFPEGSQTGDGLNKNRSEADATVMSTCRSWRTASAVVSPPQWPPRTKTLL